MKKPLLCLVGLLSFTGVFAQQHSQFVELTVGATPLQFKDHFHSPYTYRATGLGVQATYGQERVNTRWQLEFGYSQANPQSIVSRKAATRVVDAVLNYQWRLSPVTKTGNGLHYFAGAGLRFWGNSTNYSPDIEVATTQATAAFSLGASARAVYRFKAVHRLDLQAFASVVSTVYRPNYAYFGKERFDLSWFGKSPIADVQLTYSYQVSSHFQGIVRYQVSYFKYDQPRQLTWLNQGISVGIRRTF
ncbi:hypothetical protein [Larkinella terrae]|uniref:Outer membrane beta-barrel protein n=1 Tax=Larkinella terrae TaxID=2025311 RepID=A0A7K0EKC6_9BACT|nr:hypothetical protein [Larkinella terrae]MRS62182.1 hypothetical protein [Larkinella terrae]